MADSSLIRTILEMIIAALLIVLLIQGRRLKSSEFETNFTAIERNQEKTERMIREEMVRSREETGNNAKQLRDEVSASLATLGGSLLARLTENAIFQKNQLDTFSNQINDLTRSNACLLYTSDAADE